MPGKVSKWRMGDRVYYMGSRYTHLKDHEISVLMIQPMSGAETFECLVGDEGMSQGDRWVPEDDLVSVHDGRYALRGGEPERAPVGPGVAGTRATGLGDTSEALDADVREAIYPADRHMTDREREVHGLAKDIEEGGKRVPEILQPLLRPAMKVAAEVLGEKPLPSDRARKPPYIDDNPKTAAGAAKPSLAAIPGTALLALGMAMETGRVKYGLTNWRERPVTASTYINAAFRHLLEFNDGITHDHESGIHQLAHVMACCAIIIDAQCQGTITDDRTGYAGKVSELIKTISEGKHNALRTPR